MKESNTLGLPVERTIETADIVAGPENKHLSKGEEPEEE